MNRDALFTGAHVSRRPINLGGATKQASEVVVQRARLEREERERSRAKQRAALQLQRFWRGRKGSERAKEGLRTRFDQTPLDSIEAIASTAKLLSVFLTPSSTQDIKRAAAWCRAAVTLPSPIPVISAQFNRDPTGWPVTINKLCLMFLRAAPLHASSPQLPLLLEVTRMLCDPAVYAKHRLSMPRSSVANYLARHGALRLLKQLIESVPPSPKARPALPPAVNIACSIVKADPTEGTTIRSFFEEILAVDDLHTKLPSAAIATFAALPYELLLQALTARSWRPPPDPEHATAILVNMIALAQQLPQSLSSGKGLVAYLQVLTALLLAIPASAYEQVKHEPQDKHDVVIEHGDSDSEDDEVLVRAQQRIGRPEHAAGAADGDVDMRDASFKVNKRSLSVIQSLASREKLSALLASSNRFSASSRPAFASLVIALLHAFPTRRDVILNTIMFGAGERGGGVLREIWRGYIRAGALGHALSEKDRSATLLNATCKGELATDWPLFIMLSEMYSRALLTMGDDEFFGPKNPLTLDEVTGFSAMLRNLAFALYWQEGTNMSEEQLVAGTGMSVIVLRTLATTLLQQIYARDSRKQFTPKDHWLMISQFDLASFIQTVVYEDQKLDQDHDEMMADEPESRLRRPPQLARLALSKKQMAFVSPRLGILNNIPFVIPFENRVAIFRQFVQNDRIKLQIDPNSFDRRKRYRATVRRDHVSEDSFKQLNGLGAAIKYPIEIAFIDQHGLEEAGIDGGGLFKELLTSLSREAFDTDRGLWLANKEQELYPNPHSYAREPNQLAWYSFIGRILGKALYEGILIDVRFASFFLAKWLGRQSYLDDLASLDPELYNGLIFLKNYTGNVEKDLSLNFTVTEEEFGVSRTIDLIPNGSEIPVTNDNRIQYIYMTSHYRLNRQIEKQCSAFFDGLSEIIPERFLRLFNQDELRVLVGGVDKPIDLDDLRAHTVYGGFAGDEANETVRMFWDVVSSFDAEQRSKLVKFATSCARPPLLGFKELNPFFAIRAAGRDETRLPSSSTCVNLLKLPEYKDRETLREKLLYAINSGAGFDLS